LCAADSRQYHKLSLQPKEDYADKNITALFEVCDSEELCVEMELIIHVQGINDAPEIELTFDSKTYLELQEDIPASNVSIAVSDPEDDAAGIPVTLTISSDPTHGDATVQVDAAGSWTISYASVLDYFGQDQLELTATDSVGATTSKVLTLQVTAVRDTPRLVEPKYTINEDEAGSFNVVGETALIYDPEGDLLPEAVTLAANINETPLAENPTSVPSDLWVTSTTTETGASIEYDQAGTGKLTYTPALHFFGTDKLYLKACTFSKTGSPVTDEGQEIVTLCVVFELIIEVLPINDTPVLPVDLSLEMLEDNVLSINLVSMISDVEEVGTDWIEITFPEEPALGAAVFVKSDGTVVYTPDTDVFGSDSFTYLVCDKKQPEAPINVDPETGLTTTTTTTPNAQHCSEGVISVEILPVNDPQSS